MDCIFAASCPSNCLLIALQIFAGKQILKLQKNYETSSATKCTFTIQCMVRTYRTLKCAKSRVGQIHWPSNVHEYLSHEKTV